MAHSRRLRPLLLCVLALCAAEAAWAQVELVDPDAPTVKKAKKQPEAPPPDEAESEPAPKRELPTPEKLSPTNSRPGSRFEAATKGPIGNATPDAPEAKKVPPAPVASPAPVRLPPPPLIVTHATDADLAASWEKWRAANGSSNLMAAAFARVALLKRKQELGAGDLEAFAQGMLRAALAHETAGDSTGAIDLGLTAIELAPSTPSSWLGLAKVYFAVDPSGIPRIVAALKTGLLRVLSDPRYLRPTLADLANALLTALAALSVAVVLVLFIRRARYFFFDFHFLFPRALARWQSTAIAALILALPILFKLGVAACLLAAFAAVTLYLTTPERIVAAVLIALLGAVPAVGAWIAGATAFAGTRAETIYQLEQGGTDSEPIAAQLVTLAVEEKATFAELFALGRFELRRGKLEPAIEHFKAALLKKPRDPRASTNLGVAMFLSGDLENPKSLFEEAGKGDPNLSAPLLDLALLYQRRGQTLGPETMAAELDQAHQALNEARLRDSSVPELKEPTVNDKLIANQFLRTLPLATDELLTLAQVPQRLEEELRSQLTLTLAVDVPEPVAPFLPAVIALLLLLLGRLASTLQVARPCNKCGAPVSHRADPEVPIGSALCAQCVNVFALKGVVPPALKVRKQLEVSRYVTRQGRVSLALGLACSGMGHVFSGLVVRGAVYGFMFLLGVALFRQRYGVMRIPYLNVPQVAILVPLGVFFGLVYLLSLRGLYKSRG